MTVSATPRRQVYLGSGSTGPFTFNFRILNADHVTLTVFDEDGIGTELISPTDFSLSLVDAGYSGGSITLVSALASGETLLIEGNTPVDQETNFSNQGAFFAEAHEAAFDKGIMILQEFTEKLDRAIVIPAADDTGINTLLPLEENRAGKAIVFDAFGNVSTAPYSTAALDSAVTAAAGSASAAATSAGNAASSATAAASSALNSAASATSANNSAVAAADSAAAAAASAAGLGNVTAIYFANQFV